MSRAYTKARKRKEDERTVSLLLYCAATLLIIGICLLGRNGKKWEVAVLKSMADPTLSSLILTFLLAGILSQILNQSGLVEGLIWLTGRLKISAGWMPLIVFLVGALIAASCGTTNGAIAAVIPMLMPASVAMGCPPALILGAVISGTFCGVQLSPAGSITIISAACHHLDIPEVIGFRMKYTICAGILAAGLFLILGSRIQGVQAIATEGSAKTLVMLLVPVLMILLMLHKTSLFQTLLICDVTALGLGLATKRIALNQILAEEGPILSGISGMRSLIVFCLLLFGVVGIVKESGLLQVLSRFLFRRCKRPAGAETILCLATILVTLVLGADVPAVTVLAPLTEDLEDRFGLDRRRIAVLMDSTSTGLCSLLPHNPGIMTACTLASAIAPITYTQALPYSFYGILLLVVLAASIPLATIKLRKVRHENKCA